MVEDQHIKDILTLDLYNQKEAEGTLSATTLTKSAREIVMIERNRDNLIEQPPQERVWAVLGSLFHLVLSLLSMPRDHFVWKWDGISFMKNFITVLSQEIRLKYAWMGEIISGQYDFVKRIDGKDYMCDYKFTGAYSIKKNPGGKREWLIQLSINRWLYKMVNGVELEDTGRVYVWVRDWQKRFAGKNGYPAIKSGYISMKLWSYAETEEYLTKKIKEIQECRPLAEDQLPLCEDTWGGRKCADYCPVRHLCYRHGEERREL